VAGASARVETLKAEIDRLNESTVQSALTQKDLTTQLLDYGFTVAEIEQAIADLDKATDSAKQGISDLTKELLRQTDLNRARVIQEADLLAQSEQALKSRADALRLEQRANEQAIEALRASGDTSDEVTQKIKDYEQANIELSKTLDFIASSAIPNAINRARDEARKLDADTTRQDTINATKKFNSDVQRLNEQGAQELFNIEKKRTDGLLQIAERFAIDTTRALTKLNDY
jgi:chromosome segregation ATPase